MNSYERVLNAFRDHGLNVVEKGDRASCQAPGHSGLEVSVGYNGDQALVWAFNGMELPEILDGVGLQMSDLFDNPKGVEYQYPDGRKVQRTADKRFYQSGNTDGTQLYHVDRIGDAPTVYVVGGEKDVHTLEHLGLVATCNAGGEGNVGNFDLSPLFGRRVVVVRDRDEAGEKFAHTLVDRLAGEADVVVRTAKVGKDVSDHVAAGCDIDDLVTDTSFATPLLMSRLNREVGKLSGLPPDKAMQRMYALLDSATPMDETAGLHAFDDLMLEWWEYLETPAAERDILQTPWPELDDVISGGFHKGRSYLMAARPGAGKSLGLTNFASYAASQGHRGVIYSVEMGRMEVASRIVAAGAKTEYGQISQRNLTADSMSRIAEWADKAAGLPLFVCDKESVSMSKIRKDCRQLKSHGGLDFVCVDYLQLLKADSRGQSRQEQISEISRGLKMLSKELQVVVLSACQLNRGNVKDGRPPTVADLRESGSLEQDCDVAILLHHASFGDGLPTGEVEFIVGKNRTGKLTTVTLPWRAHYARIG